MTGSGIATDDVRFVRIFNLIRECTDEDLAFEKSANTDALDTIIGALETLAKNRITSIQKNIDYQKRVEKLIAVLLKYTLLDFSEKAEISDNDDEVDAMALGLNVLSEELQAALKLNEERLERLTENNVQIETLLENAPNAVIVIDEKGII